MGKKVSSATDFTNKLVNTNLNKCQNIITGGSEFGAKSLRIAANSGDLYQTVICVNNAVLVTGQNSGDKGKERFRNLEELSKLDYKNIIFISSKKDENIHMKYNYAKNHPFDENPNYDVRDCYLYSGLQLTLDNCPHSQVYFISNNDDKAFMEFNNSNYHYGYNIWNQIASDDYDMHLKYHNILGDLCRSTLVSYNGYTNVQDRTYKASNDNVDSSM